MQMWLMLLTSLLVLLFMLRVGLRVLAGGPDRHVPVEGSNAGQASEPATKLPSLAKELISTSKFITVGHLKQFLVGKLEAVDGRRGPYVLRRAASESGLEVLATDTVKVEELGEHLDRRFRVDRLGIGDDAIDVEDQSLGGRAGHAAEFLLKSRDAGLRGSRLQVPISDESLAIVVAIPVDSTSKWRDGEREC